MRPRDVFRDRAIAPLYDTRPPITRRPRHAAPPAAHLHAIRAELSRRLPVADAVLAHVLA